MAAHGSTQELLLQVSGLLQSVSAPERMAMEARLNSHTTEGATSLSGG